MSDRPTVYIWQGGDRKWRWSCPNERRECKMLLGAGRASALTDVECALGLDRSQMFIYDREPPPYHRYEKSSETVETSGPSPDTGQAENVAPAHSESDTDAVPPVRKVLEVTIPEWELVMEAIRLLKTKVDKEIEVAEHVCSYDLKGPTRQAVKASLEANLKVQESLASMILTLDPLGEFKP